MTNFNEKLDEILLRYSSKQLDADYEASDRLREDSRYEAKQSLTSLIKELVAEAKPDKLKESDYTLNMSVPHNPPSNTTRTNLYRKGHNDSLDQFEQNLLKALKEV